MCLAVPGKVLTIGEDALRMSRVAFGPVVKEVSLALVPDVAVGQYVVIHAGMALEVVDEEAAEQTLRDLDALDSGKA
jgi:hydrogenase expression/formation protein HypC